MSPLDLGFVLVLTFLCHHLVSFGCSSSRASLVLASICSAFPLAGHLLGLISLICFHLHMFNHCPGSRSWALPQYQFSGPLSIDPLFQFWLQDLSHHMPCPDPSQGQAPPNIGNYLGGGKGGSTFSQKPKRNTSI